MTNTMPLGILTINVGSSSLKFALFELGATEPRRIHGTIERLGLSGTRFRVEHRSGSHEEVQLEDHLTVQAATQYLFTWLSQNASIAPDVVVHRLVHGGTELIQPTRVDDRVLESLRRLVPLAPNHLPASLVAVDVAMQHCPTVPHIACFDTAFHQTRPLVAKLYGLPHRLHDLGLQRYGFHGLSYQSVIRQLERIDVHLVKQRLVIAHLGNGSSLCAVVNGQSVDTTMGLTPASGLVMGTRCGDIDPEIPLYLAQTQGMSLDAIRELLNRESGLLGLSGISSDVRDLLAVEAVQPRAALALEAYCYAVRKGIASMAAAAEGMDTLVFTGGIGTHSAVLRSRIIRGLSFLGIELDASANQANAAVISSASSRVTVRIIPTHEELVMAQLAAELLGHQSQ